MHRLTTLRIPRKVYAQLEQEAWQTKMKVADLLRLRIEEYPHVLEKAKLCEREHSEKMSSATAASKTPHPMIIENNLLLREIALDRNSQILDRVDEEMKQILKKGKNS